MTPSLSVIIPTLDMAPYLPDTLGALEPGRQAHLIREVIVVDGGSRDDTAHLAQQAGARTIGSHRGRGRQLALGAEAAAGSWLLFLHGDTVLDAGWVRAAAEFMARTGDDGAAVFTFALDDGAAPARRLERMVAWRCRVLGLPYGDQGLLLSRTFYQKLGGFRDMDLMEDVDLVRRIGRRRLSVLPARAVTSARRFTEAGYLVRSARNLTILALYFLKVPPRFLARLYG